VAELNAIHRMGYRGTLFFVDDNFIGNRSAVKRLLPVVRRWQQQRGQPFEFYTEASVDLATDRELLAEMVDAGFSSVFVGIETPSARALEQTKKFQNLHLDLSVAIDRITSAGLEMMGGFIVGFDSDDVDVFAMQQEFLARQPIPLAMVGLLTALPGTALWRRLELEGRLRARSDGDPFSRPNFEPAMDEQSLLEGYAELMTWLYSPRAYYSRCEAYLKRSGRPPRSRRSSRGEVRSLMRTIWHVGVLSPRRGLFWKLMARAALRGHGSLRTAVAHAVQGEHLVRYTREHVLPRLEQALMDVRSEAGRAQDVASTGPAGARPAAAWAEAAQ